MKRFIFAGTSGDESVYKTRGGESAYVFVRLTDRYANGRVYDLRLLEPAAMKDTSIRGVRSKFDLMDGSEPSERELSRLLARECHYLFERIPCGFHKKAMTKRSLTKLTKRLETIAPPARREPMDKFFEDLELVGG